MPSIFSSPTAVADHTALDLDDVCTTAVVTATQPFAGRRSIDPVAHRYARGPVAGKRISPIVARLPWLVEEPVGGRR